MTRKGLIAGLASVASVAGVALLAAFAKADEPVEREEDKGPEVKVYYSIEKFHELASTYRYDHDRNKVIEGTEENAWRRIPGLYGYGKGDGAGGGARFGSNQTEIEKLAGSHFNYIRNPEDGQRVIALIGHYTDDMLRLVRTTSTTEVC